MSPEYQSAMWNAHVVTNKLSPKLLAKRRLTAKEGKSLLDANWLLYLHALSDGDMEEAKETAEFVNLVEKCLRLSGYTVELTGDGTYCVEKRRKKHA